MNGILQSLLNLGIGRLLTLGAVGFGLLGFFFYLVTRLTAPDFALLYGDLAMNDSGAIVSQLDSLGVPYRLVGNGGQILVPSDQVSRLRLSLAQQGLPSGGSVGYEIFDEADNLGSTRFVQNVNLVRALEGELSAPLVNWTGFAGLAFTWFCRAANCSRARTPNPVPRCSFRPAARHDRRSRRSRQSSI